MKGYIEERAIRMAEYIAENKIGTETDGAFGRVAVGLLNALFKDLIAHIQGSAD